MVQPFPACNADFEHWLERQCAVVRADLKHKHRRMETSRFVFLRATFFRWAQAICQICPASADAPVVLTVGDSHVENFGVWRDGEGRLVWGVNDFDEAAEMPYALDLLRLGTSAALSPDMQLSVDDISSAILRGYRAGLLAPGPIHLDRDIVWLRRRVLCSNQSRAAFWSDLEHLKPAADISDDARDALMRAVPEGGRAYSISPRRKGGGSLGKPRFVLLGAWQGADIVREAKALTSSAWNWAHGAGDEPSRFLELARGPSRSPDPFLHASGDYLVRRLAPDSRKIEFEDGMRYALKRRILAMMGRDLGAMHAHAAETICADLDRRPQRWLARDLEKAMRFVSSDHDAWRHR